MRVDPKSIADGIQVINGGMDSGNAPNAIGRNKVAFARNVTFRGRFPRTRPGWIQRPLLFDTVDNQTAFENGLFQGAVDFLPYNGGEKIIPSIGGKLFRIDVDDRFNCTQLTGSDTNNPTLPKAWFEQAEDFLIVQDDQSAAFIYDGARLRRVNPSSIPHEIPVGNVMVYALGRLWVTLQGGKSFVAGNIVYGEEGTSSYNGRDSVLKFTENDFLNGGGAFGIPFNAGSIRAMETIANLDTSLGQGPIQVFTELGAFSVNAPFDRTTWQNLQYPIQTVSLLGAGAQSNESTTLVNGDIWFRSSDGIRSFQIARRDQGAWVGTPLSSEMRSVLDLDDVNLLDHSSAVLFDNRYLVTAAPFRVTDHGVCWKGLVALDFDNVSGITERNVPPVYDGLWTGLDILQIVTVNKRCFLFALVNNKIQLWELTKDDPFDNNTKRIASYIDTPRFGWPDNGWDLKELSTGDVWFSEVAGDVDFSVGFRPDNYPVYVPWHNWSVSSKFKTCPTGHCEVPQSLHPQYRTRMRLPLPSESCNSKVNEPFRRGFEHQVRIAWTGRARLDRLRVIAHQVQEDVAPYCQESESTDTTGINACDSDLFSYSSV